MPFGVYIDVQSKEGEEEGMMKSRAVYIRKWRAATNRREEARSVRLIVWPYSSFALLRSSTSIFESIRRECNATMSDWPVRSFVLLFLQPT